MMDGPVVVCHRFGLWLACVFAVALLAGCPALPPPPLQQEACQTPDACGGCQALEGSPGDPCGECNAGQLECDEDGALVCRTPQGGLACDDGLFCNGAERCEPEHPDADADGCVAGEAVTIDDDDPCTLDRCDEDLDEVVHQPEPGCGDCVPDEHLTDAEDCGCDGPCAQDELCEAGQCACDPQAHLSDDEDCGCQGPCAEGRSCVEGACRWPCELEGCPALSATCDEDTRVEVPGEGRCDEDSGQCDYSEVEVRTDCALGQRVCQEGACVDLCADVDCARPDDFCEGQVAVGHEGGDGACDFLTGLCDPPVVQQRSDCAQLGRVCQAGRCVDLCADVSCAPVADCQGDVLVEYLEEGVCAVETGLCAYDNQQARQTNCREALDFACVQGECVCLPEEHQQDDQNCGCQGPCDQPGAEDCQGGECVCDPDLHQTDDEDCGCDGPCAQDELCEAGQCACDPQAHQSDDEDCGCQGPCAEGRSCVEGACRWPCELEGCPALSATCDEDTRVEVPGEGRCDEDSGQCDYSEVEVRTDCALGQRVCQEGACVDLCADVDCARPDDFCEGQVAVRYEGEDGVCDFRTGRCERPPRELRTDCAQLGRACQAGVCVDLCAGVECPAGLFCEGDVAVDIAEQGQCNIETGQCEYPTDTVERVDCAALQGQICEAGECLPSHCTNLLIDGDESDVNCGGSCRPCTLGLDCRVGDDCEDQPCSDGLCAPPGFTVVPSGTFSMGSPLAEPGRQAAREALHSVSLTRDVLMGVREVTQGQWSALMGNNPSFFGPEGEGEPCGEQCPVESVNWWEALAYANALSAAEGLPQCYVLGGCNGLAPGRGLVCNSVTVSAPGGDVYDCQGYRLPTEAEWERAARGGTQTAFWNGELSVPEDCVEVDANLDVTGWYCFNSGDTTQPGGELRANAYGLYDVHGNVYEWVYDLFINEYDFLPAVDPVNDAVGSGRVYRGGFWGSFAQSCRAASRLSRAPADGNLSVGLRVVRTIP